MAGIFKFQVDNNEVVTFSTMKERRRTSENQLVQLRNEKRIPGQIGGNPQCFVSTETPLQREPFIAGSGSLQ